MPSIVNILPDPTVCSSLRAQAQAFFLIQKKKLSEGNGQMQKDSNNGGLIDIFRYHVKTLWLFTFSDFKTIVIPSTIFAILTSLSGPSLTTKPTVPAFTCILSRLPFIVVWIWLTLLLVDIANQRHPNSVLEDSFNKPWRPLPSNRLSTFEARRLLLVAIPIILAINKIFLPQGFTATVIAIIGSYMYNDLGGADESFLVRNLMNAAAITCFGAGAALVACGEQTTLNGNAYWWLAIIAAIVTTTMQVQDMEDQEGDRARGRATIPLLWGDRTARHTIAVLVPMWSFVCPAYWDLDVVGFIMPAALGLGIAARTLSLKSVSADEGTWRMWNLWMMALYVLPVWEDIMRAIVEGYRSLLPMSH